MKTKYILFLAAILGSISDLTAGSVVIDWFNYTNSKLKDINGVPLTSGTEARRDGTILQLGYYTEATVENPFTGTWVAMTGTTITSSTTMGDSGGGFFDGTFDFRNDQYKDSYSNVPAVGTPLAIRFYDSTSLATANYFNCVSNTSGAWNWTVGEPAPTITMAVVPTSIPTSATQVWQGGASSAFRTTIPIPEPSGCLLLTAAAGLCIRRKRELD